MNENEICNEALRIIGMDIGVGDFTVVVGRFLGDTIFIENVIQGGLNRSLRKHIKSRVIEPKQIEGEK